MAFMSEGEIRRGGGNVAHGIPIGKLAGRYWFCGVRRPAERTVEHKAVSTEEVLPLLDEGFRVEVIRGPLETRDEADRRLELYWEAMGSDD